jgi:predicted aminopeptidase
VFATRGIFPDSGDRIIAFPSPVAWPIAVITAKVPREGEAALQTQQGLDVSISGVEAYSTLGWFNDPIISSMMNWGDERLATLIFHELAHQRFYVKDDTEFNESFATFVEQEGTRQWRAARGLPPLKASLDAEAAP